MGDSSVLAVVNPASANGRTGRCFSDLRNALEGQAGPMEVVFTEAAGDAVHLTRQGLRDGYATILGVGGDGTANEVVNGFFEEDGSPLAPESRFAFLSRGTGGDFRKTLDLPLDPVLLGGLIKRGSSRRIDVGEARFRDSSGEKVRRFFVNILSFGLGGAVDRAVNGTTKFFGGRISFAVGTLKGLMRYENQEVTLRVDGEQVFEGKAMLVAVANGRYFGGGMMIAPDAEPDDGRFDIIVLGDLGFREMVTKMPSVYKGRHLELPKIHSFRGRQVEASSPHDGEMLIDLDGEQPGQIPIGIDLRPAAVEVIV